MRTLFPSLAQGHAPILPTSVRLRASDPYRGRGVTIAFLDSGFFAHPDLVEPRDRIVKYVDVTRKGAKRRDLDRPDESSWHGMMTSVVACGNGRLSGGIYEGLAPEANLVLVKCGTARRIRHDDIRRGLHWVIRNRKRYGIRIVNVSCGGDYEASYLKRPPVPGGRRGDPRGPAGVRGRPATWATCPTIPSSRPPPRPRCSRWAASTTRTGCTPRDGTCTTRATGPPWTACRSRR